MALYWPRQLLISQEPMFDFTPVSLSGPISGTSISDVVEGDSGFWRCTLADIPIRGEATVRAWRGLKAQLQGRGAPIVVPYCRSYQPLPVVSGAYDQVAHDDDALFDDDTGYVGATMLVTTDTALAKRATTANITIHYGDTIEPGHVFSFFERLYEVKSVSYSSEEFAEITFRPPLREAVISGDELNFSDPVCRMRLKDDRQMELPLKSGRLSVRTVEFVEDLSA
ncbi:hypothetical protein FIU93_22635 [Labrenzia sp. THAF35]|uniref:hypothetical protein n=1 Tax=Labrenzia sp. THAF35 TaxID=2587854 RepID=UPI001267906B|nr:hypothetical protein [Labrenzia sp. THAF35]QFT69600.1 hypothetical protein FIU93_22635 [Labrenzia sp. THAF35]